MPLMYKDNLHVFVLESASNFKKDPNMFNYHQFKKETNIWRSNLVMYLLNNNGDLEKKLVYHNFNFDVVPMHYQSNKQQDVILYLNNSKSEKFAIWQLDQL